MLFTAGDHRRCEEDKEKDLSKGSAPKEDRSEAGQGRTPGEKDTGARRKQTNLRY